MITDWSRVPESLVLHRFDLYVQMMLTLLSKGQHQACPDCVAQGLALRTEILDYQLRRIAAARN